jgi:hypothetical protein
MEKRKEKEPEEEHGLAQETGKHTMDTKSARVEGDSAQGVKIHKQPPKVHKKH